MDKRKFYKISGELILSFRNVLVYAESVDDAKRILKMQNHSNIIHCSENWLGYDDFHLIDDTTMRIKKVVETKDGDKSDAFNEYQY